MNHCSQTALEISLAPLITFFTLVFFLAVLYFLLMLPLYHFFFILLFWGFDLNLLLSADSLTVESLLELLDEESLRKDTALPSPEWSSDHIALLAGFRCKPRMRRWHYSRVSNQFEQLFYYMVNWVFKNWQMVGCQILEYHTDRIGRHFWMEPCHGMWFLKIVGMTKNHTG